MMVLFVSQCEKNALAKTRRVLDAFADRIGDNTWQTVITAEGLQTVKKLLRQTASKSTAVSCHWIRSRSRSDLLWVVGNKRKFNERGVVPVNYTQRNILQSGWENNWVLTPVIQIMATLGALLHDTGKSTLGFQGKLFSSARTGDPYRHEWLSLKVFKFLIKGCRTDEEWLERFCDLNSYLKANPYSDAELNTNNKDAANIDAMPPLAQWLAWLIVSHHRLPPMDKVFYSPTESAEIKQNDPKKFRRTQTGFYKRLKAHDYWVKNPKTLEELELKQQDKFWQIQQPVIYSSTWQNSLKRWASKALKTPYLLQLSELHVKNGEAISQPFLLHLSRLSLMLADHNYSSLGTDIDSIKKRVKGSGEFKDLAANTNQATGEIKQSLDEHLLGVAKFSANLARKLPIIANELPTLERQKSLEKDTSIQRFKWQNKAVQLAKELRTVSEDNGFFGVNMASTGCGKTIANARIAYALADENKGARFTIALGLRVLTLQTGQSLREDLGLENDQLATLVGGSAHKSLFDLQNKLEEEPSHGSESVESLLDELLDGDVLYSELDELNLGTALESDKAKQLLASPVVSCTIDHIMQASECRRGGKYIVPMLRLLSSDLILDEPDDFNQEDLPALARLVHLAGVFGSRVLLSSATLPIDLITGLYRAYYAGRVVYNESQNKPKPNVACAWFDEKRSNTSHVQTIEDFYNAHQSFVEKRAKFLDELPVRRQASVLPLALNYHKEQASEFYSELGQLLINESVNLHESHKIKNEQASLSVGLIRIANIKNIVQLAQAIYQYGKVGSQYQLHLCCYHAKQVFLLRNRLEQRLDKILKRKEEQPELIFQHPEISQAIANNDKKEHIFIVMATPVAEVGRDHDYDWAIVEPSSMRSIIQLAGRVWRHRPNKVASTPNISLMQFNINSFLANKSLNRPVFVRPGFESATHKLNSHDIENLIPTDFLKNINSNARTIKSNNLKPQDSLIDLEQQVMQDLMNNKENNYVNAYWESNKKSDKPLSYRSHTFLQTISPFRQGRPQDQWIVMPTHEQSFEFYSKEQVITLGLNNSPAHNSAFKNYELNQTNSSIKPWLNDDLNQALDDLQNTMPDLSRSSLAIRYATVGLEENEQGWCFNQTLGFWRNK